MLTTIIWTLALLAGLGFFAYQIYGRLGVLLRLRRDDGRDYSPATWGQRLKNTLVYAFGQWKFFRDDQPAGFMHIIIFWGFITLLFQVITMFGRGFSPDFTLPLLGLDEPIGRAYGHLKDGFEIAVFIAVSIAMFRWAVTRPTRLYGFLPAETKLRQHSHWEAYLILFFIMLITSSGLVYDKARVYLAMGPEAAGYEGAVLVQNIAWWVHNLVVLTFLNLLPRSKHFHIITAIPNVFFGKLEPRGRLAKRDFTAETPLFGRSQVNLFTWKQTLDMYSCTECGRCSSQCPATATGKPLAPRQFLVDLRNQVYDEQLKLLKIDGQKNRKDGLAGEFPIVVGPEDGTPEKAKVGLVIDEVVWSCVNCRACEEFCPVNIEYVDKIVDIRQHLVQEASRFPAELGRAFKGMENNSNPWGIAAHERDAWAEGFDVPRITEMSSEKPDVEYLYYVGCGGSFDSNNRKATQSFVRILKEAGVSFAILGKDELCNGETARRLGNEYLFQTMAETLVGTIKAHNVKKILVNCPHCFNTLKNEYPAFGGEWEVTHASALVSELVAKNKLKVKGEFAKSVVYHDSCYYGRFNDVYDEPRNLIQNVPGCKLFEMDKCKHEGMCCGAGGGRMWMEEKADQRVNILRTDQALAKNPDVIATSCPYCKIMISSGINEKGLSEKVAVMDVMEIVAQNMEAKS